MIADRTNCSNPNLSANSSSKSDEFHSHFSGSDLKPLSHSNFSAAHCSRLSISHGDLTSIGADLCAEGNNGGSRRSMTTRRQALLQHRNVVDDSVITSVPFTLVHFSQNVSDDVSISVAQMVILTNSPSPPIAAFTRTGLWTRREGM